MKLVFGVLVSAIMGLWFLVIALGLDHSDHRVRNWRLSIFIIALGMSYYFFKLIELSTGLAVLCAIITSALVAPVGASIVLFIRRVVINR